MRPLSFSKNCNSVSGVVLPFENLDIYGYFEDQKDILFTCGQFPLGVGCRYSTKPVTLRVLPSQVVPCGCVKNCYRSRTKIGFSYQLRWKADLPTIGPFSLAHPNRRRGGRRGGFRLRQHGPARLRWRQATIFRIHSIGWKRSPESRAMCILPW